MDNSAFTIYNASAGSGKTFTLVKEYLLLLFASNKTDAYRNILAVTFTNKAVAEMKGRIIENLHAFSKDECPQKYEALKDMIAQETGFSSEEFKVRSTRILKSIIHNYASFEISTIDGFTHRVLRTFAKDLDLPLNFEVELNTSEVLEEAVERLIEKAGQDKVLTKILVNFSIAKADDDKSWDIGRDLLKIAELLTKETNQPFIALLRKNSLEDFEKLTVKLKHEINLLEETAGKLADDFFHLLRENSLENKDFNRSLCPKFFEKLRKKDFNVNFGAAWQTNINDAPLYAKKLEDSKKEIIDQLQPAIAAHFDRAKQVVTECEFLRAVEKNMTPLSLLSAIQNEIEEIKKERSIVLISEFNATIGEAVKDQPAPFIYERLGERYSHYFIDEFQDTSELQWENLVPLIEHALSSGSSEEERGSLTLVGDAKQSIYRWRGGKAEQFMNLCGHGNPFNLDKKKVVVLPNNFRSAKEIVEFNNDFFTFSARCLSSGEHKDLFEKTSSQESISTSGGYVNLSFIEAETADEEMRVYPEKVLEIIQKLESREIPRRDVCILTRTAREGVTIANFLSENDIPIISYQSLLVSRSPRVNFIISVLKFALDQEDKKVKLEILEFIQEYHFPEQDAYEFIQARMDLESQELFDSLEEHGIRFILGPVMEKSIYEAVEYIVRSFRMVKGSDAYVQFFLDFVYEASQSENAGIFDLLDLWEQKKHSLSISAPRSEDAVQIMTIHKAKGLEFPVVICPFANSTIQDVRESLWVSLPESINSEITVGYLNASKKMLHWQGEASALYEELCGFSQLDALNVLYVALTRAVEQLYVISKKDLDSKGNENSNRVSGLLIAYLKSKGLWDEGNEYEFGRMYGYISERTKGVSSLQQSHFYSSPTESAGISIVTRSGMLWNSSQEKALEKGHLIHELFAGINTHHDVENVIKRAEENGLFKYNEAAAIQQTILKVISHPDLKSCYSGAFQNSNERDIITAKRVLRPDRLNFSGKKVRVIDYKTGDPSPGHQNQIKQYGDVLTEMGFDVEKKFLVYINDEISVTNI